MNFGFLSITDYFNLGTVMQIINKYSIWYVYNNIHFIYLSVLKTANYLVQYWDNSIIY